jgi:hypothetical protein
VSWVNSVLRQFLPHGSTAQDAPAHIASKKVNSGSNRWKRWVLRPWNPGGDFLLEGDVGQRLSALSLSCQPLSRDVTFKREKVSTAVVGPHNLLSWVPEDRGLEAPRKEIVREVPTTHGCTRKHSLPNSRLVFTFAVGR